MWHLKPPHIPRFSPPFIQSISHVVNPVIKTGSNVVSTIGNDAQKLVSGQINALNTASNQIANLPTNTFRLANDTIHVAGNVADKGITTVGNVADKTIGLFDNPLFLIAVGGVAIVFLMNRK